MKKLMTLLLTLVFAVGIVLPAAVTTIYAADDFVMTVEHGDIIEKFNDFSDGWEYAVGQDDAPVTITLFDDWVATDGKLTEYGYAYMNDGDLDITLDLNGHTIDRGLKTAKIDGHVFGIYDGKLTITDSVGTGKITGGNDFRHGGAFNVQGGKLYIKGGEISGNTAAYGGAIYCDNLNDGYIYIEGGKLVGNTADIDGGAIFVYNGYLEISGGEISGNTAENGAGVHWESRNKAYLIGGSIINNNATEHGGVYAEDWGGKVYVGGDIIITGNGNGNLYLDGTCIYNACGQDGAPNKPLTSDARIGISSSNIEEFISADESGFREGDFRQIYSDSNQYFIRSVYDAEDEDHVYKLYINTWGHKDARYPRVKTVSVKNNDILEDAVIDYDKQIITLKVSEDNRETLKSAKLGSLISYTCDKDIYSIYGADEARDLTTMQEYKIISDNGTYVMCIVEVEWICSEHADADNDGVCDECREYIFSETTIIDYNAQTQEATVFVAEAGKYTLVFADYEGNMLENADAVEFDFEEGINVVPQKTDFVLASGDKVMLWYDMINLAPACSALTIK